MFNWALKGVTVEKRAPKTKKTTPEPVQEVVAVNLPEPEPAPQPAINAEAVLFNFTQPAQTPSYGGANYQSAFAGNTLGNRHILVACPKSKDEMQSIVDHLKTNEAVIVNFAGVSPADTQRSIDFLSGVACGLGGTIYPIDNLKYIITPSGIGVR